MLVLSDKRCTTGGAIFRVLRCMYSLFSLGVFVLLFSSFCCVATIFLLSWLSLIYLFFFSSAAINQWPHDCMRSAGEDGGFERVFILNGLQIPIE